MFLEKSLVLYFEVFVSINIVLGMIIYKYNVVHCERSVTFF